MKQYMGFSRYCGPGEGAILIFANNIKEAKKLAWGNCPNVDIYEYTDQAVKWIKDKDLSHLVDQKKLKANIPHIVDELPVCGECGLWGTGTIADGLCNNCGYEYVEEW